LENRSHWIDYAKAIGIILVVYGHVARGLYKAGIEIPKEFYELADSIVYSFHMPLFFFLSGVFFYSSFTKKGGVKLITSKIDTIVYPYIIWAITQGVIEAFLADYTNGSVTYAEVFSLLWSPRAQFWFLYALFIVFFLAAAIFSVVSKKSAIAVFLLSAITYVYPEIIPEGMVFKFISSNFVFFMFGIVFTLRLNAEQLSSRMSLFLLACVFSTSQFIFHHTLGLNYTDKGIASLSLALISIFFIISLSAWGALRPHRLMTFIGTSSMAIYLMHILAGSGARVALLTFMGIDSPTIHLVAGCFIGIFVPLLALIVINKLKIPYIFSAPVSNIPALIQRSANFLR